MERSSHGNAAHQSLRFAAQDHPQGFSNGSSGGAGLSCDHAQAGENPEAIAHSKEDFPVQLWQRYASPIWMDINPSDTLQYRSAREHNDERHICPLQLEVIRRAVKLWSNPGDTVWSPFAGIGSVGFVALEMGRGFIGSELKGSYYRQACRNLASALSQSTGLFAGAEQEEPGEWVDPG